MKARLVVELMPTRSPPAGPGRIGERRTAAAEDTGCVVGGEPPTLRGRRSPYFEVAGSGPARMPCRGAAGRIYGVGRRCRIVATPIKTRERAAVPAPSAGPAALIELERIEKTYRMGRLDYSALRLAEHAEFFSFGTNDLTQTTLGFSRDDAQGRFLTYYLEHGVLDNDPFATLDIDGVGELISTATTRGRAVRPSLEIGLCGEHGGDPASIAFCEEAGLDYVSCSPFRVPVARLAAAQAVLSAHAGYVPAGG
jgi:hypothetical protein